MTAPKYIRQFFQDHKILVRDWVFPTHCYRVKAKKKPSLKASIRTNIPTPFSKALPQLQLLQFRCVSASLRFILLLGCSWSSICCKQLLKEGRNALQTALIEKDTQPLQCWTAAEPLEMGFSLLCTKPNTLTMLLSAACSSWSCLSSTRQRFRTSL